MESFIQTVVNSWKYHFWFSTIATVAGLLVIAPILLSKRLRKRLSKMDLDPEFVGLAVVLLTIAGFAIYNNL